MKGIIIVNLKTYQESTGIKAEQLAEKLKSVESEKFDIVLAAQNADLFRVSKTFSNVYAQHIDPVEYGSNTGKDLGEALKENGAKGVLINHAEDKRDLKTIKECIKKCRSVGLVSVVCAENPGLTEKIAEFEPDFIAIEPPELIGTLISVSKVKPDVVINTIKKVRKVNETPVLCGAGIADGDDVKKSVELGCVGVLLATAVVKAKDPAKKLKEFVESV